MFPLTSTSSTIVHPLSGPSIGNSTQIYRENRRRRSEPIWLLPSKSVKSAPRRLAPAPVPFFIITFIAHWGFHHFNTLSNGRLLGPCFKTGQMKLFPVWCLCPTEQRTRSSGRSHACARYSPPVCVVCRHIAIASISYSIIWFHALYVLCRHNHLCENVFRELTNRIKRLRPSKVRRPRTASGARVARSKLFH